MGASGNVGKVLPNTEIRVIDEEGNVCGPNQPGELIVRGPQVFSGYYRNPKATEETIRDGWLYTGDVVKYDEEENFCVVDRKKELIKGIIF